MPRLLHFDGNVATILDDHGDLVAEYRTYPVVPGRPVVLDGLVPAALRAGGRGTGMPVTASIVPERIGRQLALDLGAVLVWNKDEYRRRADDLRRRAERHVAASSPSTVEPAEEEAPTFRA